MPDQRWTNEMLVAEGDLVVIHGIREATWQADVFRGLPTPKGNPWRWSSSIYSASATA